MSELEVRISMRDGVSLAATLYLPASSDAQPCLLEALPYRKDDRTSSYSANYRRLLETQEPRVLTCCWPVSRWSRSFRRSAP